MADINLHVIQEATTEAQRFQSANQGNIEKTPAQKATLSTTLSDGANGITANVNSWVGNYLYVRWLKNNKPYGGFKSYNYTGSNTAALAALTAAKVQG